MNPLLTEALASLLRHVLTIGAGYLVARGVWSEADAVSYVGAAAVALVGIGWAWFQKFKSRSVLVTALASPKPTTEDAVKKLVGTGDGAAVTTAKDTVPQMNTDLAADAPVACVVCGLTGAAHGSQIHPFQPKGLRS